MKNKTIIIYIFLIILLNGCSSLKKGLGVEKDKPNEFLIEKRDPLVLPPNYKMLPPDSKANKSNNDKQNKDDLKSVLDQSVFKKNETLNNKDASSSSLEQEILKQIK